MLSFSSRLEMSVFQFYWLVIKRSKQVLTELKNIKWYNWALELGTKYYALNTKDVKIDGDHDFVITVVKWIFL